MHLCYKGYFKIEKYTPEKLLGIFGKNEDYKLVFQQRIISGHESELSWQEKKIFDIIMRASKSKDSTSFIELEKYMKNNTDIYHEIEEWKGDVKKEADEMDFFKKGFAQIAFTVLYVLALVANFFLMFSGSPTALVSFWVLLFSALLFFGVFREALPARTKKGAEHYLKWMKLKAFLKDFSQLSQVSPDAINLWDNFLVYAIPLGCAKEVQKAMDTAFANYSGDMHSSMFIGSYAAFNMSRFNSLGHSFNSAITSSSSTSGSSDFGGSGGGGGGGGGGGFG
ncbi:MAG: DUF2207 domain-containing protein, partial [Candidatus Diapherotrites archaeon]|nr:DUF2207 domain-containing protein [Candidatus Diapherotrites archaeon]